MGRISKAKVDEIRKLHQEGFTQKETAERVGVTPETVRKYVGKEEGRSPPPPSPELEELFRAFYELLGDLNTSTCLEPEFLAEFCDDQALRLTKRLVSVNKEFAKRVLNDNPYVRFLKDVNVLNFGTPDDQLDGRDLRLREEWKKLLKENCPEKLAELV